MTAVKTIPFGNPCITDEDRSKVMEVLNGHILTHGPQCKGFEEEFSLFTGGGYSVTTSSCMAALHMSYLHFSIGMGDEVIVPAQTHTATAHAVEWVGAVPVFADCEKETGNISVGEIKKLVTSKTKAISLVHFAGIPCDMDGIMDIAQKNNLKVIEDCAIAVGARYKGKHVGLIGDAGCFSFYPVKHFTSGEGGMFISKYKEVADSINKLRAFGVDRTHTERSIPGMYDVPSLGLNYRMSELQAALGRSQLSRIDETLNKRKNNFEYLKDKLLSFKDTYVLDSINSDSVNSHYCLCLVLKNKLKEHRNEVILKLKEEGIGTSVYYPQPVPRMTYYRNKYGYNPDNYKNAAMISDYSIAFPVGPHIEKDDLDYIAKKLFEAIEVFR
ncbi:MAG: DegT/DnrJ/EryC1/StrS family aminotransferase [Armatimonadota bacterium]